MGGGQGTAAELSRICTSGRARPFVWKLPYVTLTVVAFGLWASLAAEAGEVLQYDRAATSNGEIWRPFTSHFVHWTGRMALADLGALLILGSWVEIISRRLALACLAGGALITGAAIHLALTSFDTYRGASGIASALFAAAALELLQESRPGVARWVVALALVVFLAKLTFESATGKALAAGPLPIGVRVAPEVHLVGATAGVLAWLALRLRRGVAHGPI